MCTYLRNSEKFYNKYSVKDINYLHHIKNDKIHIMQNFMRIPFCSIELYILIAKAYSNKYTEDYAYKDMPQVIVSLFCNFYNFPSLALDLWDTLNGSTVSITVSKRMQRTIII